MRLFYGILITTLLLLADRYDNLPDVQASQMKLMGVNLPQVEIMHKRNIPVCTANQHVLKKK